MGRTKVFYQKAFVVNILAWTESQRLVSLLSYEMGLFVVVWKLPAKGKTKGDFIPNLFQSIEVAIQPSGEGRYKMRSFQVLQDSFMFGSLKGFLHLNLLARMTLLLTSESPDEGMMYHLWQSHQKGLESLESEMASLFADVLFVQGLWPSWESCFRCHGFVDREETILLSKMGVICRKCREFEDHAYPNVIWQWLKNRFVQRSDRLALTEVEDKLLHKFLWQLLPEKVMRDVILKKIIKRWMEC